MSLYSNPLSYLYRPGSLFLGLDPATNREVGVSTERHAITIAGAGTGKGAALLIPNARRWPGGLLVVDPKGENVEASWEAREALGQHVAVLDPFRVANVPDRLRASFNPLAAVDASSLTAREDIRVIADGLVKRPKEEDAEWYDGAVMQLAGIMAYVIEAAPPEQRTFAAVRARLLQADEALYEDAQRMAQLSGFGGLARAAGVSIQTAITTDKSMDRSFLGGARRATEWMDSPAMEQVLGSTSFDLVDLKRGSLSLFLVLPPQYLDEHSTFLRLFVRVAINAMLKDGVKGSGRCLMLLDEFYSLGRLDVIAKAAGLMRGYGLSLWPFLQDLGQLETLYGDKLSMTFFANADAHIFFGNSDHRTLEYISRQLGDIQTAEISGPPQKQAFVPSFWSDHTTLDGQLTNSGRVAKEQWEAEQENRHRQHQYEMSRVGKSRAPPDQVRSIVSKRDTDKVARRMIVVAKGGDILCVKLAPYFEPTPPPLETRSPPPKPSLRPVNFRDLLVDGMLWGGALGTAIYFILIFIVPPSSYAFGARPAYSRADHAGFVLVMAAVATVSIGLLRYIRSKRV